MIPQITPICSKRSINLRHLRAKKSGWFSPMVVICGGMPLICAYL
jgi:hypothetical protein